MAQPDTNLDFLADLAAITAVGAVNSLVRPTHVGLIVGTLTAIGLGLYSNDIASFGYGMVGVLISLPVMLGLDWAILGK